MSIEKKILLAVFCVGFGLVAVAQSPIPLKSLQTAVNKPGTEGDNARQVGVTDGNGKQRYVAYTDVLVSPIGYTPAATGNTINLSRFVQRNDSIWYIDFEGDSKLLKVPGGGAVNDADWLKIRNNGVPYSITDSIYTLKTVSINGRNYFPDVELNVYDSTSVFGATVAAIGNRGGRFSGYNTLTGAWSSFGQEGSIAQVYGGAGTTHFSVSEVTGTAPGSPSGTFEQHFELDLVNNNAKFNKYPNSRNDAGKPVNLLTTNSSGGVESHPVSDLKDSLGLSRPENQLVYGSGSGVTSDTFLLMNNGIEIKSNVGSDLVTNGGLTSLASWRNTTRWVASASGVNKTVTSPSRDSLIQDIAFIRDSLYFYQYRILNYVSGKVSLRIGGVYTPLQSGNGTYSGYVVSTGEPTLCIQDEFPFNMDIGLVQVRKINSPKQVMIKGKLIADGGIETRGSINFGKSGVVAIGNWQNGLRFRNGPWDWTPAQPQVTIGYESMSRGVGVAVGPYAGNACSDLAYVTLVGVGAGQSNVSGHLTAFGTKAAQNSNSDGAVFGDEAAASFGLNPSFATVPVNAHGYYAVNSLREGNAAVFGHEFARLLRKGTICGIGQNVAPALDSISNPMTTLGNFAAYEAVRGDGIFIGQNAGGTNAGRGVINDKRVIMIGDSTQKNSAIGSVNNSIAIGHHVESVYSDEVRIGNSTNKSNYFNGNFGLNKGSSALNSVFDVTIDKNANEGIVMYNPNTGAAASSGIALNSAGTEMNLRTYQPSHSVWGGNSLISTTATNGFSFLTSTTAPFKYYPNGVLSQKVSSTQMEILTPVSIGFLGASSEQLHVRGNYIRLGQMGVNGTTGSPIKSGLRFYSSDDSYELFKIESMNRLSNVLWGELSFSTRDAAGGMGEKMSISGENGRLKINGLAGLGNIILGANNAGEIIPNAAAVVSTLAAVGSTPNANAATITGSTLNLQPASTTHKGVISLTQLKFPLKMTVVDGNTDVPGAGLQTYEVIRIPACYNGYSISDVSYGVWKTGATGTAEMQIRKNGSGTAGVTWTAGQAVKDVTLTGVTVSTGDLIDVEIISNSMATPQQGLWVTIFLTPH